MEAELEKRVEKYSSSIKQALAKIQTRTRNEISQNDVSRVLDTVRRYAEDATHYRNNKDPITALAAISYAEGLLDALRFLGLAEFAWPSRNPTR